ncbi:hypothetical protein LLG10_07435 [bacterium]|nr:hypothetical protein [bacterium]
MKKEMIQALTGTFESYAKKSDDGIEFWLARDLQKMLGYTNWVNFENVINKAKQSCETSGNIVSDHFVDVSKMVHLYNKVF